MDPGHHRPAGHVAGDPGGGRGQSPCTRPAPAALGRGDHQAHSAGQHHLRQRQEAAGHAADRAGQHPARGADRLSAP
ncbi:hypothetical protein G6F31_020782 [Rhizopus arrhizus]|nr:hypothetical protein G6F24_018119 [Rhizopus arrhizus]KAG0920291.1 hypothetical protein G6F31_020782 [Rhizopus arrhizus]